MTDEGLEDKATDWIRSQGYSEENLPSDEYLQMRMAYVAGAKENGVAWHYPSKGDLPECDENTRLLFYARDRNEISNNYYCHFALGFYRPAFMNDKFNLFVEESKGYSCEHHPKNVIAWQYLPELPEECVC